MPQISYKIKKDISRWILLFNPYNKLFNNVVYYYDEYFGIWTTNYDLI